MLDRRDSQLLFGPSKRRRKSYQGPIIVGLVAFGIVCIVVSVLSHRRDDEPELPDDRTIAVHASALPEGEDFAPLGELGAPDSDEDNDEGADAPTDPNAPVADVKPDEKGKAAPAAQLKDVPSQQAMTNSAAMVDFAKLPLIQGATAPQLGRFKIIDSPLKYDENASPEVIAAAQAKAYVVVSGDVLGRIAQQHGCTIEQIQKANRMTNDQIKIGQKLLIPNCETKSVDDIQPLVEAKDKEKDSTVPAAPTPTRGKWWKTKGVNSSALPKLMAAEGFKPPKHFRAFIIEITFDQTRQVITKERAFDYNGNSGVHTGWNPASTVKIFAAIGALKRIEELGFTSKAKVTFHGKSTYSTTVSALVEAAIINSDNIAYNRVVQLASFEKLHKEILTSRYGIAQTALNRGYELSRWKSLGEDPSLRISPAISLTEGKKTHNIPAANSKATAVCSSGACTSLQDLAESTRRLMLQEQLPPEESFNLRHEDLIMLRRAMRSQERVRGTEMVDRFNAVFNDSRVKFYSKPGFSEDWFTDNAYIFDPRNNQAWIVVMTGYPGRSSLNSAATAIAKIISSGKLNKVP